jgi:glutamate dehydrogenase
MLENQDLFGLVPHGKSGTELLINGDSIVTATDMDLIYEHIGGQVETSGMTTTSVMGAFRTLIAYNDTQEESLNLMMTGGPDGDLGSNEIQCYKGKICLLVDGGSILFDPDGLDKESLMKIAFMRHAHPRANSLAYPEEKLGPNGFRVPLKGKNITLPDGTFVADGAMFHRNFITDPANRKFIEQADIQAFIPCGGFKDTINQRNVKDFTLLFSELRFIAEGANVFFDDSARRYIAKKTGILQIKDSSANKGGVFSSAVAEVLTAFLFEDDYEKRLLEDVTTRWALIRDMLNLVRTHACNETAMLLEIHEKNPEIPLFVLSEQTSEQIFAFQNQVADAMDAILADGDLLWEVMAAYIPGVLVKILGREAILGIMNADKLRAYRNAIITKKLASTAFYRHGSEWDAYVASTRKGFVPAMKALFEPADDNA